MSKVLTFVHLRDRHVRVPDDGVLKLDGRRYMYVQGCTLEHQAEGGSLFTVTGPITLKHGDPPVHGSAASYPPVNPIPLEHDLLLVPCVWSVSVRDGSPVIFVVTGWLIDDV